MCVDASHRRYNMSEDGEEELQQVSSWLHEEGLAPDASKDAQLCVLWRSYQHTRGQLGRLARELDGQRSQHAAEMAEVRRSLEQIRNFTEHKNALAEEIQDENEQLKEQLRRLVSLQDAQISEVAKMLYQQGLTELIHSSPSEQVAYLLVERASLLETGGDADDLTAGGSAAGTPGAEPQRPHARQSPHKAASRHGPWKRLFGLHKASQGKHTFSPVEAGALAASAASVERKCSRLELDLEEGSRRLAMAHSEIRRLTDELDSAHMTQRTYEPELQGAQQEVEQLRHQVEKLKKYEMVELRKAKELNERLDFEIRALRSRVRALDAQNQTLQQTVKEAEAARSRQTCRASQEKLAAQAEARLGDEMPQGVRLQTEVQRLEAELQERQQQLDAAQLQLSQAERSAELQAKELHQREDVCRSLQEQLSAQARCISEEESVVVSLRQQLEASLRVSDGLAAPVCTREDHHQDQESRQQKAAESLEEELLRFSVSSASQRAEPSERNRQSCRACQEAATTLEAERAESEALKLEICETLKSLDEERSKSHQEKEKYKSRRCRAEQRLAEEMARRDERIKQLERELSLSAHSLAKEKELIRSVTLENEKLLGERRRLLQQLSEEEHNNEDNHLTAARSKTRVDFLEVENKKLGNKILHMSKQQAALERILQNLQSLQLAEDLKKISKPQDIFSSLPSSVKTPAGLWNSAQPAAAAAAASYPQALISAALSRSAEMGYLNLTSARSRPDPPDPPGPPGSSDSLC